MDESVELIKQSCEHYPLITIIINTLDECELEKRGDLMVTLQKILQDSTTLVKIFVSSRKDQDTALTLKDYSNLEISSDRNNTDIATFVKAETEKLVENHRLLCNSRSKEDMKLLIISKVTEDTCDM